MIKLLFLLILAGLVISVPFVFLMRTFERRESERTYPLVEARFARITVAAEDPRFSFDAASAEPIHDFEIWAALPGDDRVSLNRICRNPYGEYFHVIISREDDSVYINHLSEERAALALKGTVAENLQPVEAELAVMLPTRQPMGGDAPRQSYPVVIRADKQHAGAAKSAEEDDVPTLLRPVMRLPLESLWFASATGFVVTLIVLLCLAAAASQFEMISWLELMYLMLKGILVAFLFTILFRWWKGENYSSRHWFLRLTGFFVHSWYGIALSGGVYNFIVLLVTRN